LLVQGRFCVRPTLALRASSFNSFFAAIRLRGYNLRRLFVGLVAGAVISNAKELE
jgi:hypothetical protein